MAKRFVNSPTYKSVKVLLKIARGRSVDGMLSIKVANAILDFACGVSEFQAATDDV